MLKNIALLGVSQFVNIGIPLMLLPFLAGKFTPEVFGYYAQLISLTQFFVVIIDLGFNVGAIRDAVPFVNNKKGMGVFIEKILARKLTLILIFIPIYILIVYLRFPNALIGSCLLSFAIVIGSALLPQWYYQVTGKLNSIILYQIIAKLAGLLFVYFFVSSDDDFLLLVFGQNLPILFVGVLFYWKLKKIFELKIIGLISIREVVAHYKKNGDMFWGLLCMTLYNSANVFFIGYMLPASEIGKYFIAEKLIRGIQSVYGVASSVIYMKATKISSDIDRLIDFNKKMGFIFFPIALIIVAVVFLWADGLIYYLFENKYPESFQVMKIFALLAPIIVVSNILGMQLMLPLGMDRLFRNSIFVGVAINFILLPWLTLEYGVLGSAVANIIVEIAVMCSMFFYLHIKIKEVKCIKK